MPEPLELPCNPARSQSWTDVYNSEANGGERLIEVPDSRFSYRSHSTPRHLDCLEDASIQRSDLFVRDKVAATLSPPSSKARTPLSPATAPSTIQRTPRKNPKSHPLLRLYSHPSTSYKPIFPPELTQANRQRKSRRNAYRKLSCWSLAHGQNPYYRLKRKRGQDASCTVQATAHFKPIPARKLPRKHTAKHVFSHHKGAPTSSSSPLAPSSSWHLLPFFSSSDAYNSVRNPSGANSSSIPHGGPNPTASGPSVFNTRVLRTQIRKGVSFTANIVGEAVRVSDLRGVPKAPRVPPGALDLSTAAIRLLEDRAQSMAASSLPPKIHDGWLDFTSSTPHIPASLPDEHLHESPAPSSWHPITEPPNTSVRVSPVPVDNKLSFLLHEDQDAASDKVPGSSLMPHEQASLVRPHDDATTDLLINESLHPSSSVPSSPITVTGALNSLTLMTFNVGLLEYRLGGISWYRNPPFTKRRLYHIAPCLKNSGCDVVALQEVYDDWQANYLVESLRVVFPFVARRTSGGALSLHNGLMFLSRFPVTRTAFHPFAAVTRIERLFGSKGILEATMEVPTIGRVTFMNVHLASGAVDPESTCLEALRNREIAQTLSICEKAHKRGEIPVVIGDLNAAPNLCPSNYEAFLKHGWRDAFLLALKGPEANNPADELARLKTWKLACEEEQRRRSEVEDSNTFGYGSSFLWKSLSFTPDLQHASSDHTHPPNRSRAPSSPAQVLPRLRSGENPVKSKANAMCPYCQLEIGSTSMDDETQPLCMVPPVTNDAITHTLCDDCRCWFERHKTKRDVPPSQQPLLLAVDCPFARVRRHVRYARLFLPYGKRIRKLSGTHSDRCVLDGKKLPRGICTGLVESEGPTFSGSQAIGPTADSQESTAFEEDDDDLTARGRPLTTLESSIHSLTELEDTYANERAAPSYPCDLQDDEDQYERDEDPTHEPLLLGRTSSLRVRKSSLFPYTGRLMASSFLSRIRPSTRASRQQRESHQKLPVASSPRTTLPRESSLSPKVLSATELSSKFPSLTVDSTVRGLKLTDPKCVELGGHVHRSQSRSPCIVLASPHREIIAPMSWASSHIQTPGCYHPSFPVRPIHGRYSCRYIVSLSPTHHNRSSSTSVLVQHDRNRRESSPLRWRKAASTLSLMREASSTHDAAASPIRGSDANASSTSDKQVDVHPDAARPVHSETARSAVKPKGASHLRKSEATFDISIVADDPFCTKTFTWDPTNPLNAIGPHSECQGLRCDHIFLPPVTFAGALNRFHATEGRIMFSEPQVTVEGYCCGLVGQASLVTLSDHYAVCVRLERHSDPIDHQTTHVH